MSMQSRVAAWVRSAFGDAAMIDRWERAARVLEEAIELAQSQGMSEPDVARIAYRTFSRPIGQPHQEAAQVMVTLLAWAASAGVDLDSVTAEEIERIEQPEVMARIRAKQAEKAAAGTGRDFAGGGK